MGTGYADEVVAALREAYAAAGDAARAEAMARYMKDRFPFFGIPAPERRAVDAAVLGEAGPPPDQAALVALARLCWRQPEREPQYMACDLLGRTARRATPDLIPTLEQLVTTRSWWDTVDHLASHAVGNLVRAHPPLVAEMDRWSASEDLWLARAAILHQLRYRERTDPERLFAYCARQAGHPDFFMRKAIGWALRQYARYDPVAVRAFVDAQGDALSPLSRREATKHLPPAG